MDKFNYFKTIYSLCPIVENFLKQQNCIRNHNCVYIIILCFIIDVKFHEKK